MSYSAENTELWKVIIQLGIIAGTILLANFMRQRLSLVRKSLLPIAVMAGFILLALRTLGVISLDVELMETLVYHGIALGFIAMSLRVSEPRKDKRDKTGLKSGAIIVSSYMVQAITGLIISITLAYTLYPKLFMASGLLLPMGYGQGPGQANNVGTTYEQLGFVGGHSFALAIAAAGYLCACIVGIFMLNLLSKKQKVRPASRKEEITDIGYFQDKNEIPVSDSIDKLSVQIAIVLLVYLATYLLIGGISSALTAWLPAVARTVNTLLWGFNFIIASALAMALCAVLNRAQKAHIIHRQYQNNYLLNRISGFCFDIMIVAGLASINPEDLSGLWVPFLLMAVAGGFVTWFFLRWACKKAYPDYYYEGLISMYGMMTGTIGSGILLLREIDPNFSTPAANNLILGSSYGIILGIPMLIFVSIATNSAAMCFVTLGIVAVYLAALMLLIAKKPRETARHTGR